MNYILSKQNLNLELPIEAIKYRIEQMQLKQKDLIHHIGNKSKGAGSGGNWIFGVKGYADNDNSLLAPLERPTPHRYRIVEHSAPAGQRTKTYYGRFLPLVPNVLIGNAYKVDILSSRDPFAPRRCPLHS